MVRKQARPRATQQQIFEPLQTTCRACGKRMRMAFHRHRTVTTLQGVYRLTLKVYCCRNTACPRFHQVVRPEEEGAWALLATHPDEEPLSHEHGFPLRLVTPKPSRPCMGQMDYPHRGADRARPGPGPQYLHRRTARKALTTAIN